MKYHALRSEVLNSKRALLRLCTECEVERQKSFALYGRGCIAGFGAGVALCLVGAAVALQLAASFT